MVLAATSHRIFSSFLRRPTYNLFSTSVRNFSDGVAVVKGKPKKSRSKTKSSSKPDIEINKVNFQDSSFLNAVVKVFATHTEPSYSLPWQKEKQYTSTSSAFVIEHGKLLTNAHCVEHATQVRVKKRGKETKYIAKVLTRGIECDIALLLVESEEFWKGIEPLRLGSLPNLQDSVTVVGYPVGGKSISVTKGVVSRIEVTSYDHGSDLLAIQIDAAINAGNSGGPAFNDKGECIGVAFQSLECADNIGYIIPTTIVSHFLEDYERNGKYTGFPTLGAALQKLENPYMRAKLKVPSNEGVLVQTVYPTSGANNVLKKWDVIVSFDDVPVGCDGTVPFRSSERVAFRYLVSQKFTGDDAEIGIIREGEFMKVKVVLDPTVHLVPYHIDEAQPSYLTVAGLIFTPLSKPLIDDECYCRIGLQLMTKSEFSVPRFKGEQIVVLSQVLANEVNNGYEDMSYKQVLKFNGTCIRNIHHLAHLIDSCKDKYLEFEFVGNDLVILERESALAASKSILKSYGVPSERSEDLLQPYNDVNSVE